MVVFLVVLLRGFGFSLTVVGGFRFLFRGYGGRGRGRDFAWRDALLLLTRLLRETLLLSKDEEWVLKKL